MDRLRSALEARQNEIEDSLRVAREELADLEGRRNELLDLIARAEAALGGPPHSSLTLHEAIVAVLRERGNEWTHVKDIAGEVNARRLYTKKDGSPVQPNQVHARTTNYAKLFEKDGPLVRLREGGAPVPSRPRGSKYDPLGDYLRETSQDRVTLDFDEVAEMVGGLPKSAAEHRAWWANESAGSHVQASAWMDAGWRVDQVDQVGRRVRFARHA